MQPVFKLPNLHSGKILLLLALSFVGLPLSIWQQKLVKAEEVAQTQVASGNKVADRDNCGTHIVIQSGPWEHVYCHMQGQVGTQGNNRYMLDRQGGILIWEGQTINAGTRIGRVGMTGRTTGPHLHWGLKYGKNYVDPALVLRAMYTQQRSARS